jgi:hypothetical protein
MGKGAAYAQRSLLAMRRWRVVGACVRGAVGQGTEAALYARLRRARSSDTVLFDGTVVKVRVDPHSLVPPSQQLVAAVLDAIASGEIRRATSDYASCLAANRISMGGMRIRPR